MAPNNLETTIKSVLNSENEENEIKTSRKEYRIEIVWRNVLAMIVLHLAAIYSYYWGVLGIGKWQTIVWFWIIGFFSSLGVLAGSHRLWSHKSYKAKLPLRIILAFLQTLALQNDIYEWSRDHRVHHKYSETDADPHNAKRGFFFAHMGWLLCKKHPEVKEKGKSIDMSDLWADPVVRFQRRFYILLVILIWGVFPVAVPIYFFGEPLMLTIYGNSLLFLFLKFINCSIK
jgi:stearoyl-CoA desaturase (delta-9 desaturase)